MPTYEYKCKKCGNTFEKFQPITEEPIKNCKICDGQVYRLISKNGNFVLKGSGFYSIDYRNNNHKSEKKQLTNLEKEELPKNLKSEIRDKKEKKS